MAPRTFASLSLRLTHAVLCPSPPQYMPTIGDMYTKDMEVLGAPRHIEIDDTAGQVRRAPECRHGRLLPPPAASAVLTAPLPRAQEAYADLKKEKMSTGDGYLLVYSITDDTTFSKLDRVRDEIMRAQGGRNVPVFLVGTKADLAGDRAVSEKERLAKARAWNARSFEVSAKANNGIAAVFDELVQAILQSSGDFSKGSGGGSVLGAGIVPDAPARKRKVCSFL